MLGLIDGVLDTAEGRLAEAHSQSDGSTIRRLVKDAIELARLTHGAKAEALHSLLLKALELSEIRRQWDKQ